MQSILANQSSGIKLIFLVHFILITFTLEAKWLPSGYLFYNSFFLIVLLWSLHQPQSEEPLYLSLAINVSSILFDSIMIGMYFDSYPRNGFSIFTSILNLILRVLSSLILLKYLSEKTGRYANLILPVFDSPILTTQRSTPNRSSYQEIDPQLNEHSTIQMMCIKLVSTLFELMLIWADFEINLDFCRRSVELEKSNGWFEQNYTSNILTCLQLTNFTEISLSLPFSSNISKEMGDMLETASENVKIKLHFEYYSSFNSSKYHLFLYAQHTADRCEELEFTNETWTSIQMAWNWVEARQLQMRLIFKPIDTFDSNELTLENQENVIYIKSMVAEISLSNGQEFTLCSLEKQKKTIKLSIDDKLLDEKSIERLWKYVHMPKPPIISSNNSTSIVYTLKSSTQVNLKMTGNETQIYLNEQICINFHYWIEENRKLIFKIKLPNLDSVTLFQLTSTYQTDPDKTAKADQIIWYPSSFCLNWFISNLPAYKINQIVLEMTTRKSVLSSSQPIHEMPQKGLIALSNIQITRYNSKLANKHQNNDDDDQSDSNSEAEEIELFDIQDVLKLGENVNDYLSSWNTNGKSAINEWHFPVTAPEIFSWYHDKSTNRLTLRFRPAPVRKEQIYYLFSDWVRIRNSDFFEFKIQTTIKNCVCKIEILNEKFYPYYLQTPVFRFYPFENQSKIVFLPHLIIAYKNIIKIRMTILYESKNPDLSNVHKSNYLMHTESNELAMETTTPLSVNDPNQSNQGVDTNGKTLKRWQQDDARWQNGSEWHSVPNIMLFSQFQMSDPCNNSLLCNGRGQCETLNSTLFKCDCVSKYHGKHCEYENRCIVEHISLHNKTGKDYCDRVGASRCRPVENWFDCICKESQRWDVHTNTCVAISPCLFVQCQADKVCKVNQYQEPFCACRDGYKERKGWCERDLCSPNPCAAGQHCLTQSGRKLPVCYCPFGFYFDDQNKQCKPDSIEMLNPFIAQKLGCSQIYQYDNSTVKCACYKGYQLARDGKNCFPVEKFEPEKCPQCNSNQICIHEHRYKCICRLGFWGRACRRDVCQDDFVTNYPKIISKTHTVIQKYCFNSTCSFSKIRNMFECDCNNNGNIKNFSTGLCEIPDVCSQKEQEECSNRGAVCVPRMTLNSIGLKHECKCLPGHVFNKDMICYSICEIGMKHCEKYKADRCEFTSVANQVQCLCPAGYVFNSTLQQCVVAQDGFMVRMTVRLNLLSSLEPEGISGVDENPDYFDEYALDPNLFISSKADLIIGPKPLPLNLKRRPSVYAIDCTLFYQTKKCVEKLKMIKNQQNYFVESIQKQIALRLRMRRLLQLAIDQIVGPDDLVKISVLSLPNDQFSSNITDITVEFTLDVAYPERFPNQKLLDLFHVTCVHSQKLYSMQEHTPLLIDSVEYIKKLEIMSEDEEGAEESGTSLPNQFEWKSISSKLPDWEMETNLYSQDNKGCALPSGLFIPDHKMDVRSVDLCDTSMPASLNCMIYSQCYKIRSKNTRYRCKCGAGYEKVDSKFIGLFESEFCRDINECIDPNLNKCDKNSQCINTIGSYDCHCLPGFKKENDISCTKVCDNNFVCEHGECQLFHDNYERCICEPGYKDNDCTKLDSQVIYLQTTIATFIIVMSFIIFGIFTFSFMIAKKIELESIPKDSSINKIRLSTKRYSQDRRDSYDLQILETSEAHNHQNTTHSA